MPNMMSLSGREEEERAVLYLSNGVITFLKILPLNSSQSNSSSSSIVFEAPVLPLLLNAELLLFYLKGSAQTSVQLHV